ncbi:hypothetical protein [Providencia stuartii]|uniref:hypothetical protein n=1 Tax=Providencia stuartii TaxID=588 RepID=UPI003CFED5FB
MEKLEELKKFEIFKVYNYTSDTQEFISESDGYIDENTPLIPFCTRKPPLEPKDGYLVVFNIEADEWEYKVEMGDEEIETPE